jgi:uncharacterized membrane protein
MTDNDKGKFRTEKKETHQLRADLQEGDSDSLRRRRWIINLSLLGIGAMAAATLFQTGIIKHLPDPPLKNFDADAVTSSDVAYALGVADAALSVASLAANIPAAAFGGEKRFISKPLIPIAFAGKATAEAVIAGWFFYRMATKEKKWCGYCITNAAAIWGIALLSLPEAKKAFAALKDT